MKKLIIDCVSDLHGNFPQLKGGDLLLLGGDYTGSNQPVQWLHFFEWVNQQKYRKKIYIAGNHDKYLDPFPSHLKEACDAEYLCDSGTTFEGFNIWGSPWTPLFAGVNPHCTTFMQEEEKIAEKFSHISKDTHILLTHSPPLGKGDKNRKGISCGSYSLKKRLKELPFLILHVFGHLHEGYGRGNLKKGTWANVSFLNDDYEPVNPPMRFAFYPETVINSP